MQISSANELFAGIEEDLRSQVAVPAVRSPNYYSAIRASRILRLHKGGTGILKIGKALGIGTGTIQRVQMEQPRPFGVAEAAFVSL